MKAKKSLGQHFLTSEPALQAMIEAAEVKKGDLIVEAGPGKGVLTRALLQAGAKVLGIEKDDRLAEFLKDSFRDDMQEGTFVLMHGDILQFELKLIMPAVKSWKLVSNIPYYITGSFLRKFLSASYQPERMVLMIQKEVAERIAAKDGKESMLSLSVKAYGKPRIVKTVKAGSFSPAPAVDSAILCVSDISREFFTDLPAGKAGFSEDDFFKMIRAAFLSKRKKLSSNLSEIYPKESVLSVFNKLELDTNTRAEDLNLKVWKKLAENLL